MPASLTRDRDEHSVNSFLLAIGELESEPYFQAFMHGSAESAGCLMLSDKPSEMRLRDFNRGAVLAFLPLFRRLTLNKDEAFAPRAYKAASRLYVKKWASRIELSKKRHQKLHTRHATYAIVAPSGAPQEAVATIPDSTIKVYRMSEAFNRWAYCELFHRDVGNPIVAEWDRFKDHPGYRSVMIMGAIEYVHLASRELLHFSKLLKRGRVT